MGERDRGLAAFQRQAWGEAYRAMHDLDRTAGLGADDLEHLAIAAYMICRDQDAWDALDRAYAAYLADDDRVGAVRSAFWHGLGLMAAGQVAQANGWFSRATRLLDRELRDCVERGYLLVLAVLDHLASGDWDAARIPAEQVAEIGERFGDRNLTAFALIMQGRALLKQGRVRPGLALLDEGMLAVTGGELSSPLFTGLLYCNVIESCQEVYELRRAGEWTDALARWCAGQPELVNFTGLCLVHRAEILQQRGAWGDALTEAGRAVERLAGDPAAVGAAHYRRGEVHRLRGEVASAEAAYSAAGMAGWQPQPGLALLRLAQGRPDAASAAICRVLDELTEPLDRARMLPAAVEIMAEGSDIARARAAAAELVEIAERYDGVVLSAHAAHAHGVVAIAEDDARGALLFLRRACRLWQQLDLPYELARSRLAVGLACRALGDDDSAALELAAARAVLARLGAAPDPSASRHRADGAPDHRGLTAREAQVLRLVADGRSNRDVAAELMLSERTVERHVSNILAKLGVPSRAAATAYAHRHQLV